MHKFFDFTKNEKVIQINIGYSRGSLVGLRIVIKPRVGTDIFHKFLLINLIEITVSIMHYKMYA